MKIGVIGIGCTKFGELWDKSLQDLLAESMLEALSDANISPKDIDTIFTGNMCAGTFSGQLHLGAMAAEILNSNAPSTTVEAACASGSVALRSGIMSIASGLSEVVMINGVEKMTDLSTEETTTGLIAAASEELEHFQGATFPALNALIARAYMDKFNLTRKQLSSVSIKNHKHGLMNPLAHFRREIKFENFINSPMVADPLSLLDCPPISDGAASIILCGENFAKKLNAKPVWIIGSSQASDTLSLQNRETLTSIKATKIAAATAYKMAILTPQDIDVVELHAGFSIMEIISLEDLGFFEKGKAGIATESGKTFFDATLPINPSGGLKAKGHPVGATGVSQAVEIVKQLRGECDKIQVKNAKIGLTHNMGGCGSTSTVHIFKKG